MDFNPHSLHTILTRIREQMRCPQCGTRVLVDFPSIKITGEDFMLLQLKCESCNAFIVLHVNLTERGQMQGTPKAQELMNASSTLSLSEKEMAILHGALKAYDGSFEELFRKYGKK